MRVALPSLRSCSLAAFCLSLVLHLPSDVIAGLELEGKGVLAELAAMDKAILYKIEKDPDLLEDPQVWEAIDAIGFHMAMIRFLNEDDLDNPEFAAMARDGLEESRALLAAVGIKWRINDSGGRQVESGLQPTAGGQARPAAVEASTWSRIKALYGIQ